MRVRFCPAPGGGTFFDRDMEAVPRVGDTIRLYDQPELPGPSVHYVDEVIWDVPTPRSKGDIFESSPVTVEVRLTRKTPKGR